MQTLTPIKFHCRVYTYFLVTQNTNTKTGQTELMDRWWTTKGTTQKRSADSGIFRRHTTKCLPSTSCVTKNVGLHLIFLLCSCSLPGGCSVPSCLTCRIWVMAVVTVIKSKAKMANCWGCFGEFAGRGDNTKNPEGPYQWEMTLAVFYQTVTPPDRTQHDPRVTKWLSGCRFHGEGVGSILKVFWQDEESGA